MRKKAFYKRGRRHLTNEGEFILQTREKAFYQQGTRHYSSYLFQAVLVDTDKVECVVQEVEFERTEHSDREFDAEMIYTKPRSAVRHRRDHL